MQSYSLLQTWNQADFVAKITVLILLCMSILSWTIILIKSWKGFWRKKMAKKVDAVLLSSENFPQLIQSLGALHARDFHQLAFDTQTAFNQYQQQQYWYESIPIGDWIAYSIKKRIDHITEHLQTGLAALASIGSTAPFIGLFGTIWGIYTTLLSISTAGPTSIEHLAGPIGESLIMAALGLGAAIPAILGYNALIRCNKGHIAMMNRFGHILHAYFESKRLDVQIISP